MYAEDSFFTLTPTGQVGLALLSAVLCVLTVLMVRLISHRVPWVLRVPIALALFWAFVWLSPQVYYTYYMTLFDGLVWQSVIHTPPDFGEIFNLVTFRDRATLSEHSKGALAWLLVIAAMTARASRKR